MKHLLIPILLSISIFTYADDKSDIDQLANPVMELFNNKEDTNNKKQ